MTTDVKSSKRASLAILSLLSGVLLVGASLIWPQLETGRRSWTEDKARAYQEASKRQHELSFRRPTPENKQEREQANANYLRLRAQLEEARQSGETMARWIRWTGFALVATGIVLHLSGRTG